MIRITKKDLRELVKEAYNQYLDILQKKYFNTIEDFSAFLDNIDGTIEYYYLSKEESGLDVDIYVDDCRSYQRHNHPLFAFFCDGVSHNSPLVPISVSEYPCVQIENYNLHIPQLLFEEVANFISTNASLLHQLADEQIDSVEFSSKISKESSQIKAVPSYSVISEMAKIENKYSHIGFDIFIDATPRTTEHSEYRIKYPINKDAEQGNNSHNFVPMSISPNPEFLPPAKVKQYNKIADKERKKIVQEFIKKHYQELQKVADGLININKYKLALDAEYKKRTNKC